MPIDSVVPNPSFYIIDLIEYRPKFIAQLCVRNILHSQLNF